MNNLLNELVSLWSFSLRELRMWQAYRSNQLMWVLDIFVNGFLFFLVGQLVGGSAASLLGVYGNNYVSFILIGMAVNYVMRPIWPTRSIASRAPIGMGRWTCTCSVQCPSLRRSSG
jgi:hypothetical protein